MPAAARKGDPISHGGEILDGSGNVFVNGVPKARKTDPVFCVIHGIQSVVQGSPDVFVNGLPAARVGDLISCGAIIVAGSPNVFVNGVA